MTALEITLTILLYISLGLWICQKRDWYGGDGVILGDQAFFCVFAIVCTPLNLLIVIFKELILREWKN